MERCPFLIPQDKKLIDSQKSRLTKIFNQEKKKINPNLNNRKFIRYYLNMFKDPNGPFILDP